VARGGKQVFTVREIYVEMLAIAAESTIFNTMQRMKEPPTQWSVAQQEGFVCCACGVDASPAGAAWLGAAITRDRAAVGTRAPAGRL